MIQIQQIYLIPLFAIIAAAAAYFFYRKSDLSDKKKYLLSTLRFISIFLILFLFLSPVISFFTEDNTQPVHVILGDNSMSMTLEERNDKLQSYTSVLSGDEFPVYSFADKLSDSLTYTGTNTDLTYALNNIESRLAGKKIASVTVISDGVLNPAGNFVEAALKLNAPFNFVLTGDTVQKRDVSVRDVYYNRTALTESTIPIKAVINSYGYTQPLKINLYEENNLIQSKTLNLTESTTIYNVDFNIISGQEGYKKFRIEAEKTEGEITDKNNNFEFFIDFRSNKFKVLVVSGGPSQDYAFFKEEIEKINNFEVSFLTAKSSSEFYEGAIPDAGIFDCFVLFNYPTQSSGTAVINSISEQTQKKGATLVFFAGRNTDYNALAPLSNILPFNASSYSGDERNTGVRIVMQDTSFTKYISSLPSQPDLLITGTNFSAKSNAIVSALSSQGGSPLIITRISSSIRSGAFLGHGYYNWRLKGDAEAASKTLNSLIAGLIFYTSDKDAKSKFKIETSKPVYSRNEDVRFNASLNNDYTGGEKIRVKVSGGGTEKTFELDKISTVNFGGIFTPAVEGGYIYTAELLSREGNVTDSKTKRLIVSEDNTEFRETKADASYLRRIVSETNGNDFTNLSPQDVKSRLLSIKTESTRDEVRKNFDLTINPYYLIFLITIMSIEWFLRKRNNLP